MTFWTLQYNGVEKTFQEWGFTDPQMSSRKLSVVTFKVRIPGATNLVAVAPIPFKGKVIIRRGRAADLSGGEIVFQGRQINDQRTASRNPADVLTFGNAWWDLENLTFQQQWKSWDNGLETEAIMPFCQLTLFQDFETGYVITNGAQVREVITWAAGCGVDIQAGTIDLAWYIQPYPASALSCASAIQMCLKPSPGSASWIDMSTTPPTFNCRERTYHAALALPYAGPGHRSSELVPRYDMQAPQVVLQYRQGVNVTVGDSSSAWTQFYYDAWPLDGTLDAGVRGGKQVGAVVVPIQLADYQRTDLVQKVTSGVFGNPPSLDWWKSKKRALADYTDLAFVAGSLKVLNAAGADVTSWAIASGLNEFIDGSVATWMRNGYGDTVGVIPVTVQGAFTYSEMDENGIPTHKVTAANPHVISVNTRLTNSAVGMVPYTITSSLDTGQTPVANLAQYIWTLLSQLFWDGSHSIVERNVDGAPEVGLIVDCRYALNLTGGAAAWASMLSPVHGVDIDFTYGRTDIQFGLPQHVGPADLEQLCQFYKFRRQFTNTSLRTSGSIPMDSGEVGGATARENTSNSKATPALHSTVAGVEGGDARTFVEHDAEAQEIRIKVVDTDGAAVAGFATVSLNLGDLEYA